jgi:hypothetical protein
VDKDVDKIAALSCGEIPIYEPGLKELVVTNVREGRLSFTSNLSEAVSQATVVFIAVATPSRRGDGHADLSYVYIAAQQIAVSLTGFTVVVTKSTVPVGTGDEVEHIIRTARPDADFAVVSNPEFLREGAAIEDFKHPDRILVGLDDERARAVMDEVYRPLYLNAAPRRRPHRDEHRLGVRHRRVEVGGEGQAPGAMVALDQLTEARLVDRDFAGLKAGDPTAVDVDADDGVAEIGQARTGNEADIAGTDHCKLHGSLTSCPDPPKWRGAAGRQGPVRRGRGCCRR